MSKAFITGITGQDGSYLAELLLEKGYQVIGLISKEHGIGYDNIEQIKDQIVYEEGDLLDKNSLARIFEKHKPDEVYNLAGLTYVPASWEKPTLTLDINTLGVTRILELIVTDYPDTKFYQASSSRIFGVAKQSPQTESTPIQPLDPYSVSKAAAHFVVQGFRKKHGVFACCGILYNHESERRGPDFVTKKITQAAAKISQGIQDKLELGDLDSKQDWGYAPDYVEAMWLMLQQDKPDDFVISSGQYHTVRDVCQIAFKHLNLDYQDYVQINTEFVRGKQEYVPLGDNSKAREKLAWQPKVSFEDMIVKMVDHDLELLKHQ